MARRRLAATGHGAALFHALCRVVLARERPNGASLLDVGCGEGAFVRSLEGLPWLERHAVDISAPSIELAAKAAVGVRFVVANADRVLPYGDHSFDFITSIDARLNAREFRRLLAPRGLVIIAVPGADDLLELRERIQGARVETLRTGRIEKDLGTEFALVSQSSVHEKGRLEPSELRDLLTSTYRGARQSESAAVVALTTMDVTLSHDILVFESRS